uniref:Uncharacterized protein n=1 Tax=Rhizophora mucronata TaxID=61149 RepID=A0A2P2QBS8_RHIMU
MRAPNSTFLFLVFLILLAGSQLSSCRHLHESTRGRNSGHPVENQSSTQFSWHFSAKAPEGSNRVEGNPVYGASYRTVPAGPNPLHN